MKLKVCLLSAGVIAALAGADAVAYEAGDIIVRAGAVTIAPDEKSSGIALPALGMGALAGTHVQVGNDTQLGLSTTYMLNSRLGVELLAATPFRHGLGVNLSTAGLGVIRAGAATHLPPTLSLVWYPVGSDGRISPYLGAGVNYTVFFKESVHGDLEAAAGALAGLDGALPMSLKLDNSLGLAAQVGVDIDLAGNWHINGAVRWIDIETDATFKARDGAAIPSGITIINVSDVKLDSWVYQINIGYRF